MQAGLSELVAVEPDVGSVQFSRTNAHIVVVDTLEQFELRCNQLPKACNLFTNMHIDTNINTCIATNINTYR